MPTKLTVAVACVWMLAPVMAGDSKGVPSVQESRRDSLRGLAAVYVLVAPLKPDAEMAGLSADQFRTDIELSLRIAGIPILTEKEGSKKPGSPYLFLDVNFLKAERNLSTFSIRLSLIQNIFPQRSPHLLLRGSTWSVSNSGYVTGTPLPTIRESVRDFADRFSNDFLTVNPKNEAGKPTGFSFAYTGPLKACKKWGKTEKYIEGLKADYTKLQAHFPEKEVRKAARQACKERAASEQELAECRACMEELITGLYKGTEGL